MEDYKYDTLVFALTVVESVAIILGNGVMAITFLRHRHLLTSMNWYICSMCFSGLITGFLLPLGFGTYIGPYTYKGTWLTPCQTQKFKAIVFYAAACNSILCLLAIAVERRRSLLSSTMHNGTNKTARWVIPLSWAASTLYAVCYVWVTQATDIPIFYEGTACATTAANETLLSIPSANCSTVLRFCYPQNQAVIDRSFVFGVSTLLLIYVLPLVAISLIYAKLVRRLLGDIRRSAAGLGSNGVQRAKLRAIRAMLLVVALFVVCWMPGHILTVLSVRRMASIFSEQLPPFVVVSRHYRMLQDASIHLAITHHWVHTIVYQRYSRQISLATRETLGWLFCSFRNCLGSRRHKSSANVTTMTSATL